MIAPDWGRWLAPASAWAYAVGAMPAAGAGRRRLRAPAGPAVRHAPGRPGDTPPGRRARRPRSRAARGVAEGAPRRGGRRPRGAAGECHHFPTPAREERPAVGAPGGAADRAAALCMMLPA